MSTTTPSEWLRVNPTDPLIPSYSVFTKPIQKSEQDDRDYRIIKLDNGLQATLVHDAKADKAAASLDVAVGHLYDPDDMPGLAHFCEHLLFMGTEQFPKENEYSEYLAKNNGASNAYTSTSNTNYYFNVATPALPGALERFAGFFHSPLFAPSCTSRELNAVNSENQKNHQADMWRIFQLNKHLSREGHPWKKFGTGNRDSLTRAARELKSSGKLSTTAVTDVELRDGNLPPSQLSSRGSSPAPSAASSSSETESDGGAVGRETRRRLIEWWTKEYCAGRMRLCIVGKESLDELSRLASTLFSPIRNRGRDPLPMISEHPFGPNEKGTIVYVKTVMAFHALEVSFPLEYQAPMWREKPANFLAHFMGHEGPGSLHSYLKHQGWITSLGSGPQNLARGFAMFKVTIHLTDNGFSNYRSVILATFKYLSLLRESSFDVFHQQELVTLASTKFRFSEKRRPDDYATWISEHMAWPVPLEYLLSGPQRLWNWSESGDGGEKKVRKYLQQLRVTEGRVVLMARGVEHAKLNPEIEWEKEPWYGTEYHTTRFDDDFITEAEGPNDIPELYLPGPNKFIPSNFSVDKKEVAEPLKRPHLIRETPLSTLWHKKDDKFWVPKARVVIDMRSALSNISPRKSVLTRLYSDVVNDTLTEFSYDAQLAGLSYNFMQHPAGLYVSMSGYNDKMSVLVQHVLDRVKELTVKPDRLAVLKEQAKKDWENFFLGQPYSISDTYGRYLLTEHQWTYEEMLGELSSITAEEIKDHMKKLLSQVNMRILAVGNMYKDEAIKIAEIAEEALGVSPLSSTELNDRCLILPEGCNYVWSLPLPNLNEPNSSLTYYLHFGSIVDQQLRVTSALLIQILSEPTFNVLRTKEQLGYIVSCGAWSLAGASEKGMRIVVQSEKKPIYLEERVEAFLDTMKKRIEEMSVDEFESQKSGLEKKWTEADKNLSDEASKFVVHLSSGQYDFLRNENDARLLRHITKEDVLALFMSRVHPGSLKRSKLSVQMISKKPRPAKISLAACREFEKVVRESNPDIDTNDWDDTIGKDAALSVTEFGKYWGKVLEGVKGSETLFATLPSLLEKYPVEGEEGDRKLTNATYIEDAMVFKGGLAVSVNPGPLVHWGDLPVSRF